MNDYKKLRIWQESHKITLDIYEFTKTLPKEEKFGLISQIRRASSSIPINIVEGCSRNSKNEFAHFLNIAIASAAETEYILLLCKDLYPNIASDLEETIDKVNKIKRSIYNYRLKVTSSN